MKKTDHERKRATCISFAEACAERNVARMSDLIRQSPPTHKKDLINSIIYSFCNMGKDCQTLVTSALEHGAKINKRTYSYDNWGCLHFAVYHINSCEDAIVMIRLLVRRGANINMRCNQHLSPLHTAVMKSGKHGNNPDDTCKIINVLLELRADPRVTDLYCDTPLLMACRLRQENIIKVFIDNHVSIDERVVYTCVVFSISETTLDYLLRNGNGARNHAANVLKKYIMNNNVNTNAPGYDKQKSYLDLLHWHALQSEMQNIQTVACTLLLVQRQEEQIQAEEAETTTNTNSCVVIVGNSHTFYIDDLACIVLMNIVHRQLEVECHSLDYTLSSSSS
jgi:hypothetical protein